MRIGLDARYASDHFPGIGRYIVSLAQALADLEHGHTLVLICGAGAASERYSLADLARAQNVELVQARSGPFSARQQYELPRLARRLGLDVLHSPYFIKPYFGLPCPSVVTIYDTLGWRYPHTLSRRGRLLYRLTMGLAIRSADAIITISESARAELARAYGLAPARVTVTPLAAEGRFQPQPPAAIEALRQRLGLDRPYVLYLGSNKPHKNLERLVRAWEQAEAAGATGGAELLLAGHEDPRHPVIRRLVAEMGLDRQVRLMPNIPDADLPALYAGALFFAFPSYYEGFGLPPLEAMACGTAVLCASTSSLPEVVGDAALTVDPFSPRTIAAGLIQLLRDPALRSELSERGLRRSREFTWRRSALGTLRVYESAASSRR